jgi:hypothetical protein
MKLRPLWLLDEFLVAAAVRLEGQAVEIAPAVHAAQLRVE